MTITTINRKKYHRFHVRYLLGSAEQVAYGATSMYCRELRPFKEGDTFVFVPAGKAVPQLVFEEFNPTQVFAALSRDLTRGFVIKASAESDALIGRVFGRFESGLWWTSVGNHPLVGRMVTKYAIQP